jgi:hypothetical protein
MPVQEDLVKEVAALKDEIVRLKADVYTLTKNQSSRRGLDGSRGEVGATGAAGRDAVVKIIQVDNTVKILSDGHVAAEIFTVPGKDGRDGAPGAPCNHPAPKDGASGRDGKDAPSLDEIVQAVLENLKTRFAILFS